MKRIIAIWISLAFLLMACQAGQPDIISVPGSSQEVSLPEDSSANVERQSTGEDTTPAESSAQIDSTEPQQNESGDWSRLSENRRKILDEGECDLIAVSTASGKVELDNLVIKQEACDTVPNSAQLPVTFVGFITRYNDCSVRVQTVLSENGKLYFPKNMNESPVLGETVFEKSGISGAYGLTIPYINEPDAKHPGETNTGCRYAVTFEWEGGSAVYYSAGHDYYYRQSSANLKSYYMPDAPNDIDESETNPEKESPPTNPTGEYEELPQNVVLPDAKTAPALLNEAEQSAFVGSVDIEEIKRLANEKNFGISGYPLGELKIDNIKRLDGIGYLVTLKDGESAASRVVTLYDANKRLVEVTTNYESYNHEQQQGIWPMGDGRGWLVGSGQSLFFIAASEGAAHLIRQAQWLSPEIKDPENPAASMYFGATFLAHPYSEGRPQADSDMFFAVQRRGGDLTALLYTKAIWSKTAYVFQDLMREVIATPEQDFTPAQPYEASFDRQNNLVRVAFPTSCTILDFDFNNFSIAYNTNYTEELLKQEYSQMLDSTYDGRFQLWEVNVRHGFESIWGSYVVYDTQTGYIQDFGAVGQYIRPTFADDRTAAVYYYEEADIGLPEDHSDYAEKQKASIRQRIVLYDLIIGEKREPKLDFTEFGWSELVHGYAWDSDTRQHIVLSTSMFKNPSLPIEYGDNPNYWSREYKISYFSAEGALQGVYKTGVNRFEGMFVYILPSFRPLGGGRVTLYRTGVQREGGRPVSYAFDPETGKLEDYFNADREKQLISYAVGQWAQNGIPKYSHRVVSDYVDSWVEQPQGAEVFAYFIDQLQKTPCWVTDSYSPETGILVADDIYNLKFYWLSEDGKSIVTDQVRDKHSIWGKLYKPLYVQDSECNWYGVYLAGERLSVYRWDDDFKVLYYIPFYTFSPILPRGVNIYTGATADIDIGLSINEGLYPHSGFRWDNGGITIYNEKRELLRIYIESDSIRCVAVG